MEIIGQGLEWKEWNPHSTKWHGSGIPRTLRKCELFAPAVA